MLQMQTKTCFQVGYELMVGGGRGAFEIVGKNHPIILAPIRNHSRKDSFQGDNSKLSQLSRKWRENTTKRGPF